MMPSAIAQKDLFTKRWRQVRKPRALEENHLQIPLVSLLRLSVRPGVLWRHVPNGGARDKSTGAKLKAMGTLAGSADLEFFWKHYWEDPFGGSHSHMRGLFMELKLPGRRSSPNQELFAQRITETGGEYHIVTSIRQALDILAERGLLHRGVK